MTKEYNYKRLFFHRPFLTASNLRLWTITLVVTFILVIITNRLQHWALALPEHIRAEIIREEYIALLMANTNFTTVESPDEVLRTTIEHLDLYTESGASTAPVESSINKKSFALNRKLAGDISGESDLPGNLSLAPIISAIEAAPGYVGPDIYFARKEKSLTYREKLSTSQQTKDPINIPEPEYFQFSSQNGNRDLYETTAVIELNENDIEFCFDKYARYDKSLSGNVLVSFTIHPDGYVIPSSIKILNSNIRDPRIVQCITKSIRRWRNFPQIALEEGMFTVKRKYVF